MVKTRSQQRIAFPRRKARSHCKQEISVDDDLEDSTKMCCITTLTRSCRDKITGAESPEKCTPSPAKKKRTSSGYVVQTPSADKENEISRGTRRILSYEDDDEENKENNNHVTPVKTYPLRDRGNRSVAKSPLKTSMKTPCIDVIVHSPRKTSSDTVFLHGSPVPLSPAKMGTSSSSSISPPPKSLGKRRRSSTTEKAQLAKQILKKTFSTKKRGSTTSDPKTSPSSENSLIPSRQMLCLGTQDAHLYKEAKHVLHSSIPSNLLCRESEIKQIDGFLKYHLANKKPGSLYISGAPGTGKTACLTHILEKMQKNGLNHKVKFINCMNMSQSHRIFSKIAEELMGWDKLTNKEAQKFLEKKFTSNGPPLILVLDEIDQLESKNQDVLYTMFEWPSLKSSQLILIGIANALDLTDRVLPRLQLRGDCKPKLLHFSPYAKDEIVKILTARLSEIEGSSIVDISAVQFCARKIAAVSGDMRKALDICRRAVEVVEAEVRKQQVLKPIQPTPSPKKVVTKKVTIAHVSRVIAEVYGSRIMSSSGAEQPTIPLQQKLLICTILLMQKETKLREIPVGQLHETYCNICKRRQVSKISQEDCLALCNLLETRGILCMKRAKETRMTKVSLKIDEKEVDHALQDKILLSSILQAGLATNN